MKTPLIEDKKLQEQLLETVLKIPVDYAEIRAEQTFSTSIAFKGPEPEAILEPEGSGFFIRVLVNGSWGVTTFTHISLLKEKIDQAIQFAKLQGKGRVKLIPPEKVIAQVTTEMKKDFRNVPLKEKVDLVKKYNHLLLTTEKGIQTSNTRYQDKYLTKFLVSSQGSKILQVFPYVRLVYQAMGQADGVIEMYRGSEGRIGGFEAVENLEEKMVEVARTAMEIARAPKMKSGKYTAILDPYMAGTFAHEAFGHLSEADHQYESPQLLKQMAIGKKLGSDEVTIVDDPNIPNGWGNFTYDDEGVKAQKANLMIEGTISARLHSLETAAKLDELPNGRARADGYNHKPIIRMSNTFFAPGKSKLDDLVTDTKEGLLVVSWLAGMTAMENFTFTGMYGVKIENGQLTEKVRGVKLLGNVFETLKDITAVSTDFGTDEGTCGKEGQHMAVGSGGGYVMVNNLTVGGE